MNFLPVSTEDTGSCSRTRSAGPERMSALRYCRVLDMRCNPAEHVLGVFSPTTSRDRVLYPPTCEVILQANVTQRNKCAPSLLRLAAFWQADETARAFESTQAARYSVNDLPASRTCTHTQRAAQSPICPMALTSDDRCVSLSLRLRRCLSLSLSLCLSVTVLVCPCPPRNSSLPRYT